MLSLDFRSKLEQADRNFNVSLLHNSFDAFKEKLQKLNFKKTIPYQDLSPVDFTQKTYSSSATIQRSIQVDEWQALQDKLAEIKLQNPQPYIPNYPRINKLDILSRYQHNREQEFFKNPNLEMSPLVHQSISHQNSVSIQNSNNSQTQKLKAKTEEQDIVIEKKEHIKKKSNLKTPGKKELSKSIPKKTVKISERSKSPTKSQSSKDLKKVNSAKTVDQFINQK